MRYGEQYTVIRGHLLLMNHIPNLTIAYCILMQEENQRESVNSAVQTDYVALSVTHGGNSSANKGMVINSVNQTPVQFL